VRYDEDQSLVMMGMEALVQICPAEVFLHAEQVSRQTLCPLLFL
jgi:hypothetical protein